MSLLSPGQVVKVRSRRYLVEAVEPPHEASWEQTLVGLPHNGHSNSFSALLAMLDPQRFIRGEQIKDPRLLDQVMVRRLKDELRDAVPGAEAAEARSRPARYFRFAG
jgi:hypothetical protein